MGVFALSDRPATANGTVSVVYLWDEVLCCRSCSSTYWQRETELGEGGFTPELSVLPSHAGSHILSRLSFWSGLKNCCLHLTLTGVCWGKEGNKLNPIAENEVHFGLCSKVDFNQKDGCGNITVSIGLWIPKILLMLLSFSRDIGTPRLDLPFWSLKSTKYISASS